jgi:hypothetical protein
MKTLLAGLFVIVALVVSFVPSGVGAATNPFRPAGIVPHSGSAPSLRAASSPKTLGTFNCGSISCATYQAGVDGYFQDVAAAGAASATDNVYSVDTQYSDNTGSIAYNETFGGSYVDTHGFPSSSCPLGPGLATCVTETQLVSEINKAAAANGWTPSPTHLFFIFLPAGVNTCFQIPNDTKWYCATNAFCAYHDSSGSLYFAVQPFNAAFYCRAPGQGFPNGTEIDEEVNTISHEQNEAITDPDQSNNAWYSSSQDEIGDLCAWSFGAPLGTTSGNQPYNQVINGHDYSLQLEYSNAANNNTGGCVSHLGGPATPISDGGAGPLTYHGGPVMTSNTVYSIYWLPGPPPVNSDAPTVSGNAAVGQQLSTTNGTWTNTPTTYAYAWQRCNNVGSNCSTIPHAIGAKYKLVTADAGHEIRSEVRASNSSGPAAAYTPSTPSAVVLGKPKIVANSKPLTSGTTTVGQALSVNTGTWTNSPTSYAYQWLRCARGGGSCVKIGSAKSSSYTLTAKDAGHKLEANVTATNLAGSGTALSNKSAIVTS